MAYTAGFSVTVGNPTKASDISTLSANDDYLKAITDALLPTTGNLTNYVASDGSDPTISLGTSATNRLLITSDIASGSQELDAVNFSTVTAASGADKGKFVFAVDEVTIATIDDDGIDLAASKAFTVNGSAVTTSPAGSNTQIQYNNSGSFGGAANLTFDGTDLEMYKDANNADSHISIGTSAAEAFFLETNIGTSDKLLKNIIFRTETAQTGTSVDDGGFKWFVNRNDYTSDSPVMTLMYQGFTLGLSNQFSFDYDQVTLGGTGQYPLILNASNATGKKLKLQGSDDAIITYCEGTTDRANVWWDASADSLIIDNLEESTALAVGATIAVTGALTATGDITSTSDVRLKSDVKTIEKAVDKIDKLRGVSFVKEGKRSIGVIAQEVEKVIPEVVYTDKSKEKIKNVAYGNLVGLLIEGMKEQQKEIDRLKLIVTGLGNKLR
ncbi:MAG: hypothetical protein CMC15_14640 [Flavobacteriaceae bacterium]|nr:hypothetical protein [Flavobacteriaceae bacterium]